MKLRNQLLALACLIGFVVLGYFYVRAWVVQKPFGVILFVSDGLLARQLTIARLYEGGADARLALEAFPNVALLRNSAKDYSVPDAAAAATALATGTRVSHRTISVDAHGQPLRTILDLARSKKRSIGLVTNGPLTAPTAAAFYAHSADARETAGLALQFTEGERPAIVLGGGSADFLPESQGGQRKDGRNLITELQNKGVELVRSKADLENISSFGPSGLVGLFSAGPLAFSNQIESGSQQPSLSDMVRRAIGFLQQNRRGYVLVVDAALVTTAAERNEGERTIAETLALDKAIETAMRYAGEKALILAVGKHSTGGLALNGYPLRQDHGVALLGSNAAGYPYLTWATGPNGPAPTNPPPLSTNGAPSTPAAQAKAEPAAFQSSSALNNAEDVLAVGRGPGSEKLHGWLDNTAIFELIKEAL
ncbi:alkaline phosphatase [Verrucomicrobiota bacterium sgz303538]